MLLPGMRGKVDFKKLEVFDILKKSNKIIHYSIVLCVWVAKQAHRATETGGTVLRMSQREMLQGKIIIIRYTSRLQKYTKLGMQLELDTPAFQFHLFSCINDMYVAERPFNEYLAVIQYESIAGNYVSQS